MRVLVTGISGFVGSHFAELALAEGAEVYGSSRWRSNLENIEHLRDRIHLVESDMRDLPRCNVSSTSCSPTPSCTWPGRPSWPPPGRPRWRRSPRTSSARPISWRPRAQPPAAASARGRLQRGVRARARGRAAGAGDQPAPTTVAVRGEQGGARRDGLPVLPQLSPAHHPQRAAFNHEGPRRADVFVTSSFARQIAEIERGEREPVVRVGNLKARRD